jgi:hypothetical protein
MWFLPPFSRRSSPGRGELLDAVARAERVLAPMVGRWSNGISPEDRTALTVIYHLFQRLLIRAGRL